MTVSILKPGFWNSKFFPAGFWQEKFWQDFLEPFTDSASLTNLKRSMEKYIYDNLYTTEGLVIDFEGLPFDNIGTEESWLQPRIANLNREYLRGISSTKYANQINFELTVFISVKRSGCTLAHKHYLLRDKVSQYFAVGKNINFKDYIDDSATLANIKVREFIKDSPLPETESLLRYEVGWLINYIEEIRKHS